MNLSNEQLNQLAITAQQHPPGSLGRQTALRQLVDGIMRSNQLGYPQRGQFPGRYREIYDEAVQDLLLYICQSIQTYDSHRGSVLAWANMLLERRFFKQAIPKVVGKPALQCVSLDALEGVAAPQVTPALSRDTCNFLSYGQQSPAIAAFQLFQQVRGWHFPKAVGSSANPPHNPQSA